MLIDKINLALSAIGTILGIATGDIPMAAFAFVATIYTAQVAFGKKHD